MLIKICGNTTPENTTQVEALQPDLLGLIFYPGSKRYVGDNLLKHPFEIKKAGVFVNEQLDVLLEIANRYKLTHLQLHGDEPPQYCAQLKAKGFKVYKAIGVSTAQDILKTTSYDDYCDHFLFDTKTPNHGGSGRSFDWNLLNRYKGNSTFFLSGGIGLENIKEVLSIDHPKLVGVDLNSRLEIQPGIKDINKTKQIIKIIRQYERNTAQ